MDNTIFCDAIKDIPYISTHSEKVTQALEVFIENTSDAMISIDKNCNVTLLNSEARTIFYLPDEVKKGGDTFWHTKYYDEHGNIISPDDMPGLRVLRGERLTAERIRIIRPDKRLYVSVSGSPIYDDKGQIFMGILCIRDITNRVDEELMLKTQYDYMNRIFNSLDLPLLRLSYPDLNIIELNRKALNYLCGLGGYKHQDIEPVEGRKICDVLPNIKYSKYCKALHEMARIKNIVYLDNIILTMNGQRYYWDFIFQPLLSPGGDIIEVLIVVKDVTCEVQRNKELEKLLKTQEEFFSFISHEFKTPITVTSTAIQAMKLICGDELPETAKGFLQQINKSTLQQLRLVNNLLDITRSDAGYLKINKRNLDIISLTREIIDSVLLYASDRKVNIRFSAPAEQIITAIDDEKYERILLNLLSNAIKFTPEGKGIDVSITKRKNNVCIAVKDEGIGIPRNKQHVIFKRFIQSENGLLRNSQGTGIGLCLVKLLVKALGGKISVNSEEGLGSTFTVLLPLQQIDSAEGKILQNAFSDRLGQIVKIELSGLDLG